MCGVNLQAVGPPERACAQDDGAVSADNLAMRLVFSSSALVFSQLCACGWVYRLSSQLPSLEATDKNVLRGDAEPKDTTTASDQRYVHCFRLERMHVLSSGNIKTCSLEN